MSREFHFGNYFVIMGRSNVKEQEKEGYFSLCLRFEYVYLCSSSPRQNERHDKLPLHLTPVTTPHAQPSLFWLPKSCPFFKVQFKSCFLVKHSLTISSGSNLFSLNFHKPYFPYHSFKTYYLLSSKCNVLRNVEAIVETFYNFVHKRNFYF